MRVLGDLRRDQKPETFLRGPNYPNWRLPVLAGFSDPYDSMFKPGYAFY